MYSRSFFKLLQESGIRNQDAPEIYIAPVRIRITESVILVPDLQLSTWVSRNQAAWNSSYLHSTLYYTLQTIQPVYFMILVPVVNSTKYYSYNNNNNTLYQIFKEEIASSIRSKALLINFSSHNDTLALNLHYYPLARYDTHTVLSILIIIFSRCPRPRRRPPFSSASYKYSPTHPHTLVSMSYARRRHHGSREQ